MSEIAQHFELIEDDPEFGMAKGDILACIPYDMDPEKLTVAFRVSDRFDPSCNVYRSQVRAVPGVTPIRWRNDPPYGAEPDTDAVLGDDAQAASEARVRAERDLTSWLVIQVASHASGDPEDTYEQYLQEAAGKLGINLEAALDEAAEKGWLDDIDRPGEEVRREPQIGQENVEAICAQIVGPDRWPLVEPKARFDVAEQVLEILNAAKAEGWTPPAGDAS
jgi:hypothetical protein